MSLIGIIVAVSVCLYQQLLSSQIFMAECSIIPAVLPHITHGVHRVTTGEMQFVNVPGLNVKFGLKILFCNWTKPLC